MSAITELLFNNDASKVRLGTLIKQVSARNRDGLINIVMSVSNKHGFIAQSEQFEDRTVASEDTTNYKVIKSGIFAYNPARINVGSIAQYKGDETCIVSPMYLCFKCGVDVVGDYLEHFFSTKYFFKEMDKRLEGSVRQCLSFEALCNIPIPLPSIEQQHCTATIIGGISQNDSRRVENTSSLYETEELFAVNDVYINIAESKKDFCLMSSSNNCSSFRSLSSALSNNCAIFL